MNTENKHKDQHRFAGETDNLAGRSQIRWGRSKEQVWMDLEKRIANVPAARSVNFIRTWPGIAMAAGLALLVGMSALIGFYTKTVAVPAGQHLEVYLPDNSTVMMNAQSTLSYKPFLWMIERTVRFEGEARFDVMKGKQFEIISEKGRTIVLGTTFNIYSRQSDYQVTCITGRVKVLEITGTREVTLNPGQQAAINSDGDFAIQSDIDTELTLSWINNKFSFTSVPLVKVFEEIGRQYGVEISIPAGLEKTYTGTFVKDSSVENVLNLVCRPFDLNFTRKSDNEYSITGK